MKGVGGRKVYGRTRERKALDRDRRRAVQDQAISEQLEAEEAIAEAVATLLESNQPSPDGGRHMPRHPMLDEEPEDA